MAILIVREAATEGQLQQMLEMYSDRIKTAVDIDQRILAGGGELHADCEEVLLENGSRQPVIWAASWYPSRRVVECDSMVNVRPRDGNSSMIIQDPALSAKITGIIMELLGGAQ